MRLRVLALALFAICLATSSAWGAPKKAPPTREARLEARLEADTGTEWKVEWGSPWMPTRLSVVGDRSPRPLAVNGVSHHDAAIAFLRRYGAAFGAPRIADELELVDESYGDFAPTLSFVQRIPGSGVRVLDHWISVDFNKDGAIHFIQMDLVKGLANISPRPKLTVAQAERRVARDMGAVYDELTGLGVVAPTELVVIRLPDGRGRLAYLITCSGRRAVDAQTGRMLMTDIPRPTFD
jgi:hypothetical protein